MCVLLFYNVHLTQQTENEIGYLNRWFKGWLQIFFGVHVCVILGDFYYVYMVAQHFFLSTLYTVYTPLRSDYG